MNKKLRTGLIGGGLNSAVGLAHLSALRMDGLYEISECYFSPDKYENEASHEYYGYSFKDHPHSMKSWLDQYINNLDLIIRSIG